MRVFSITYKFEEMKEAAIFSGYALAFSNYNRIKATLTLLVRFLQCIDLHFNFLSPISNFGKALISSRLFSLLFNKSYHDIQKIYLYIYFVFYILMLNYLRWD